MIQPTDHKQMFFKPGISPFSINEFMKSPGQFWMTSSYNPNKKKMEPSSAMIFGRLVHALLLTPDMVANDFAVAPSKDDYKQVVVDTVDDMKKLLDSDTELKYKKSSTKEELKLLVREKFPQALIWDDELFMFNKSVGRKDVVSKEDMNKAKAMVDVCMEHSVVRQLLGNGCAEEPLTWYNEEGGLVCKAKVDYLRNGLWIDYKTTREPDNGHVDDPSVNPQEVGLAREIAERGYHRQAAWGMDGIQIIHGERPRGAVIIAQSNDRPELISVSALTQRALSIGQQENAWAYAKIKEHMQSGKWPYYDQNLRGVDLPRWYKSPVNFQQ